MSSEACAKRGVPEGGGDILSGEHVFPSSWRRQNLPRLLLALSLKDDKNKNTAPLDVQKLTGHSISILCRRLVEMVQHHHRMTHGLFLQLQAQFLAERILKAHSPGGI